MYSILSDAYGDHVTLPMSTSPSMLPSRARNGTPGGNRLFGLVDGFLDIRCDICDRPERQRRDTCVLQLHIARGSEIRLRYGTPGGRRSGGLPAGLSAGRPRPAWETRLWEGLAGRGGRELFAGVSRPRLESCASACRTSDDRQLGGAGRRANEFSDQSFPTIMPLNVLSVKL
jgi:hypothetical protein